MNLIKVKISYSKSITQLFKKVVRFPHSSIEKGLQLNTERLLNNSSKSKLMLIA